MASELLPLCRLEQTGDRVIRCVVCGTERETDERPELYKRPCNGKKALRLRGLGDLVAAATSAAGIEPASCEERQAWLNKLVPFGANDAAAFSPGCNASERGRHHLNENPSLGESYAVDVKTAIANFDVWCQDNRSSNTRLLYRSRLRGLESFTLEDRRTVAAIELDALTRENVEAWLAAARKGKAPDTERANAIAFKAFQAWAVDYGHLKAAVVAKIKKPMGRQRIAFPKTTRRPRCSPMHRGLL